MLDSRVQVEVPGFKIMAAQGPRMGCMPQKPLDYRCREPPSSRGHGFKSSLEYAKR